MPAHVHDIYETLLSFCPRLRFGPPWDFLRVPADLRGPPNDPAAALADLRTKFPDWQLAGSGLLRRTHDGLVLAGELAGRAGAIIPLRCSRGGDLFGLMTPRTCLPAPLFAPTAVLDDDVTAKRLAKTGVLTASPFIRDVALLRTLSVPATLSLGLHRSTLFNLQDLDGSFAGPDLQLGPDGPPARPTLALVGWSPQSVTAAPPPGLAATVTRLRNARRYLGVDLAGVSVWTPPPERLEELRFAIELRNRGLAARTVAESAAEDLVDFDFHAGVPTADPDFAAAGAELYSLLAADAGCGRPSPDLRAASETYAAAVERDLVGPLNVQALATADPVARAVTAELATVSRLLHQAAPLTHAVLAGPLDPAADRLLDRYLRLLVPFGSLTKDLAQCK
jgi:hypothetical protein